MIVGCLQKKNTTRARTLPRSGSKREVPAFGSNSIPNSGPARCLPIRGFQVPLPMEIPSREAQNSNPAPGASFQTGPCQLRINPRHRRGDSLYASVLPRSRDLNQGRKTCSWETKCVGTLLLDFKSTSVVVWCSSPQTILLLGLPD